MFSAWILPMRPAPITPIGRVFAAIPHPLKGFHLTGGKAVLEGNSYSGQSPPHREQALSKWRAEQLGFKSVHHREEKPIKDDDFGTVKAAVLEHFEIQPP